MHAIKGGWVGQTFALAKCNDSGGRKSRIRRSKEERKAMVESFIKKYQNSNNGNFPSLNLTHKEVGGSFYTVREIVREIIQENRVLGPAKLTPEAQNSDRFAEQYPLGSISMEPQVHLSLSANGTHTVPNHLGTSEELVLNLSRQHAGPEHQMFDNGQVIKGSQADEINKESDELINTKLQVSETLEADKDVVEELEASTAKVRHLTATTLEADKNVVEELEASTAKVSHLTANTLEADKNVVEELEASTAKVSHLTANVVVETFPLSPVAKPNNSFNESLSEASDLTGTLGEKETKKMELEPGNQSALENSSGLVDESAIANPAGPLLERNSGLEDEKALVNLEDPSLESSNCSTTKGAIVHDNQDGINLEVEVSRNNVLTSETFEQGQPTIAPNGMHAKDFNGTNTSSSGGSDSPEAMMVENKVDVQGSSSSQKGSNPTLDRINLESWEEASKKPAESETNPFLAFLKAFVAAFVKFWSE